MGQRFETYAERYRAQAEQSPLGQELKEEEVQAIEEDLRILGDSVSLGDSGPRRAK